MTRGYKNTSVLARLQPTKSTIINPPDKRHAAFRNRSETQSLTEDLEVIHIGRFIR